MSPPLRPAVTCVFAAAVSAATAAATAPQISNNQSGSAKSSIVVHPCSLSPSRHVTIDKQDSRPNPESSRSSKQLSKRSKTSDGPFAASSRVSAPTSANMKAVPEAVPGAIFTFASAVSALDTSSTLTSGAAGAAKESAIVVDSSANRKGGKRSAAYERLKSKLWTKLHTKFRRETQPAVDVELLKVVFDRYA